MSDKRCSAIESPCIKVCELNRDQICTGCGRTLAEITDWPKADGRRKLLIRRLASKRLAIIRKDNT